MEARIPNPALTVPGAMDALMALNKAASAAGVPHRTLEMVHLRASQINGCAVCVDMHSKDLKRGGETDERMLPALAALDPDHRAVIVLRYLLEYTPGEIADLLDLPRGTVNSRLRRGLDKLRERLE